MGLQTGYSAMEEARVHPATEAEACLGGRTPWSPSVEYPAGHSGPGRHPHPATAVAQAAERATGALTPGGGDPYNPVTPRHAGELGGWLSSVRASAGGTVTQPQGTQDKGGLAYALVSQISWPLGTGSAPLDRRDGPVGVGTAGADPDR